MLETAKRYDSAEGKTLRDGLLKALMKRFPTPHRTLRSN